MSFKENLINVFNAELKESSKEMIDQNATSFDAMSMSTVTPGEFAQNEITNAENLINKGKNSNTTDFNKEDNCTCNVDKPLDDFKGALDRLHQMLNISAPADGEVKTLEIIKKSDDVKDEPTMESCHRFGESAFAKMIESVMQGKSCEEHLSALKESEYSGPRDYNPDVRLNVSDVVNALKREIGKGSEGIHVDQEYDERHDNVYKVSQIDKDLLPKTLQVETTIMTLDGDIYIPNKITNQFPLGK